MKNVAFVLSSKPKYSETFIIELIKGLKESNKVNLEIFYKVKLTKWCGLYMIYMIIRGFFFAYRVFQNIDYIKNNDEAASLYTAIMRTLDKLPIITSTIKFDYIHFGYANLAINNTHLGKHFGAKVSLSLRGYDITFFPTNHKDCYKNVWNNIDQIQFNSYDLLNWAYKWGASPKIPSSFISAAVNDEFILKNTNKKEIEKNSAIRILTVGRLHWKKGIDTALYAVAECIKENMAVRYTLIGNGPEIEKIKYLIVALKIEKYVEIKKEISHSEVINVIDQSDLIVVPSVQEGCSNFVLESQARGKYCIVSDAEGMNQVILNKETGKIIKRGDFIALKDAIVDFSKFSLEKRKEISFKAITRIENEFKRSTQIEKWLNFFYS